MSVAALTSAPRPSYAYIATLGGKAQNFTFPLDVLMRQGLPIVRALALHLAPDDRRTARTLNQLRDDFEKHVGYAHRVHFDSVVIRENPPDSLIALHSATAGHAINDVDHPAAADAIWMTAHHLIRALQNAGYTIALCVTGGPRLIGLQAMSVASLLFRHRDMCYHLFTPRMLRVEAGEGAILHAPASAGIQLIEVPLLPLGMIAPSLQAAAAATPEAVLGEGRRVLTAQEQQRCEAVLKRLKPRAIEVLRAFARDGADVASVSRELHIGANTVNSHKTHIFDECRAAWEMPHATRLTHRFLHEKFGGMREADWVRWLPSPSVGTHKVGGNLISSML